MLPLMAREGERVVRVKKMERKGKVKEEWRKMSKICRSGELREE